MRRHNSTTQYQWLFICSNKRYEWHLVFTESICNFYHYFHAFTPPARYWMQHKHQWEVANEKGPCDNQFSSVQSLSRVWLFVTPWTAARHASLSFTNSWSLLRLISIGSVMPSISSSVVPFSSCLQSFPASGSFQMSQFFASGGQRIAVSVSASVLPVNIQDWFPLGWTGWVSLLSKGLSRIFSNTTVQKDQFFGVQPSLWSNSHIHTWLLEKAIALTRQTFVGKVMPLLFNMLSKFNGSVKTYKTF